MDKIVDKILNILEWIVDNAPLIGLRRLKNHPDMVGFKILQAPMRLLYLHQFWPHQGEKLSQFWPLTRLLFMLTYSGLSGYLASYYFYIGYRRHNTILLDELIEGIILIFIYITIYYTIYVLVGFIKKHSEFIYDLQDYSKFGKPPDMDEANRRSNMFSYAYWIYGVNGTILYSLQGLIEKEYCEEHSRSLRLCGFLLPLRFPFPVETLWAFIITWFIQTFSMLCLLTSGIAVMVYLFSTVELVNAKVSHLKQQIMLLGQRPQAARHGIRYCVEYHAKIINMCKNLNIIWGKLMLYHQILVTIIESLIGIQFLLSGDPKCILHGSAWMVSLAIPCLAGQRFLDEASEIPMAIYSCDWYDLDKETRKDLVYMLMCANNELNLNQDGYGAINLSIVGKVVNNIYSVLMLLYSTMTEL